MMSIDDHIESIDKKRIESGNIGRPRNQESIVTNRQESLYKIRHSCAHILAQAVLRRFRDDGPVGLGVGPPVENGFYYDFDLPRPIDDNDLSWIEEEMKSIIRSGCSFEQEELSYEDALKLFQSQPLKRELIELICAGESDDNGVVSKEKQSHGSHVSIYRHSDFADLCKGPHVASSKEINENAIKITSVAGAYWRGNEKNQMLVRIYATAWNTREELLRHLAMLEQQKLRDHREIGKRLEIFHIDPSAPGMPYWLPNGLIILNELLDFWRKEHVKRGYKEFSAPIINHQKLWSISGHWEHYRDNMFIVPVDDEELYGVKPMNCPNAMLVYNLKLRSYRELPLRLSDCDVLHRNERSGTLQGLLRAQKFQQDDAHIFLEPDQVRPELREILQLCDYFYSIFGLEYSFRLGRRPSSFIGDSAEWDRAEAILADVLDEVVGEDEYAIVDGEGAFYGPKIDILMRDCLGRRWQMGTIQLDFQLPERFNCRYIDRDGNRKVPCVIHRVIYGSIDRFIGILLEHTAGNLPLWLAPVQAMVAPISDRHLDYGNSILDELRKSGLRCEIDDSNERINKKIRNATLKKIPYVVVIGDQELKSSSVSIRYGGGKQIKDTSLRALIDRMQLEINEKEAFLA